MSQGKLNAIPPGTGGVAGQMATNQIGNQIAQQGQASMQQTPPLGTMPGTFGRAGGSVQQPTLGQFEGIGPTAPVTMPGGQIQTMENKYPGGIPGLNPNDPRLFGQPGGVNTPAPEDELDALPGPDSMGGGY
jgi:hypothetical protein